jgi:platelet-activating factor acetylhydrolase IB subunit beta/gamma
LKLDSEPHVQVLDLTSDFLNSDGSLIKALYTPDNIHISAEGYTVYANRLKPLLESKLRQ